jgi:hypothetical protein
MSITNGHQENKADSNSCVVIPNVSAFLARQWQEPAI